jgi:lysophospholipase L1-like esterase
MPTAPASPSALPVPEVVRLPTIAVFLGDSYTTGWNGAGIGEDGWPAIVASAEGWTAVNLAVAGTGFINPGWTGQPVRTRLAAAIAAGPSVVVVAAGHNDRRYGAAAPSREADAVLSRLRAELPRSAIVVVGPIWQSGRVPASLRQLRDHLRETAARVDAVFIDPIAEGWFAGSAERLISGDGIHPTNPGHRRMAELVLATLEADPRLQAPPGPRL